MGKTVLTINGLVDWRLCLGCGACAFICPERKIQLVDSLHEGIRPVARNEACESCRLCLDVCPAWINDHRELNSRSGIIPELREGFGPVLEIYEGHACDPEIRYTGASGGAITALALFCLERREMHGVLHIGPSSENPMQNSTRLSRSRSDLLKCAGSRYAPASACDRLDLIETAPAPCAFIGKPSEVTALKKAQKLRPSLDSKVGLTISFMCAGTPSTQGTLDLLRKQGIAPGEVTELRYRGLGWPGMFAARRNGHSELDPLLTYKDSWGFLQKHRPFSEHIFPDGCGEDADISCGDPWHKPPAKGEAGRSLILARTERGREILRAAAAAGYLKLEPSLAENLVKSQENLLSKRGSIWGRILAFRLLGLPYPRYLGFSLFKAWARLPLQAKAKSILGTMRRVVQRGYLKPNSVKPARSDSRLREGPDSHSTSDPSHTGRFRMIGLMGASLELGNRGVGALAASLIKLLCHSDPGTEITFLLGRSHSRPFTLTTSDTKRELPVVNYRLTPRAPLNQQLWWILTLSALYRVLPFSWVRERILTSGPWFRTLSAADWVGDIRGGDSFSDIYGMKRFLSASLAVISVIWIKGSVVLFPQTYGPFRSRLARWLAAYILKRSRLALARDHESYATAMELAPEAEVKFCPDVAFMLDTRDPGEVRVEPGLPYPLKKRRDSISNTRTDVLIGLNVSGLLLNGGYNRKNMFGLKLDYSQYLVRLIQSLLESPENRVLLVPHTFGPPSSVESDPGACASIRDRLDPGLRQRVHLLLGEYDQSQIKAVIGQCDFFIGSRMHACIAALSQGIPTAGVAYSKKFRGVFDVVGARAWVVDGRELDVDQALAATLQIYIQREQLRAPLREKVQLARELLLSVFDDLKK